MRSEMGHMANDWRIESVQARDQLGKNESRKDCVDEGIDIGSMM